VKFKVSLVSDSVVIDAFRLLKQENTSSNTTMDDEDVARFMIEVAKAGEAEQWRGWLHSHGGLGCFWSSTDEQLIEEYGLAAPWWVSVVTNKKGETLGRLDTYQPFRLTCTLPVVSLYQLPQEDLDAIEAEFKEKCSQVRSTFNVSSSPHHSKHLSRYSYGGPLFEPEELGPTPKELKEAFDSSPPSKETSEEELTVQDLYDQLDNLTREFQSGQTTMTHDDYYAQYFEINNQINTLLAYGSFGADA